MTLALLSLSRYFLFSQECWAARIERTVRCVTVDALPCCLCARFSRVVSCCTFRTGWPVPAVVPCMAEPEAAEAPHRTWEVRTDLNLHIADSDFPGHIYLVESQNYVVGRLQHTGPLRGCHTLTTPQRCRHH